jgi:hypothetical protein
VRPEPETEQLAAFVEDHLMTVELPSEIEAGVAEMDAVAAGATTVTEASS